MQGHVGPAEAWTLQVFSHFFTPKPRARSGTLHRQRRVNSPPAAAELPDVAAPGAQRTRRGIPPFQRASLPGCHHPPGSTRGRPCCGGRRHQVQRRLKAGANIESPERSALAATAKATTQPPAPGHGGTTSPATMTWRARQGAWRDISGSTLGEAQAGRLFTSGASAGGAEPGSERGRKV